MDNITHSLVGALIGTRYAAAKKLSRWPIISASILANNFPDLDMLYAKHLSAPFGYLLHHRGHTHTIVGALICGVLVWVAVAGAFRLFSRERVPHLACLFVALLGSLIHICCDALNTYGVHPFWPVRNEWIYGDVLFIVEPLLWVTLSLAILDVGFTKLAKAVQYLPAILGAGLIIFSGKVPVPVQLSFFFVVGLILLVSRTARALPRSNVWCAMSLIVLSVFAFGRSVARAEVSTQFPGPSKWSVAIVSPSPANPLCWSVLRASEEGDSVVYRQYFVQPFKWLTSIKCADYQLRRAAAPTPARPADDKSEPVVATIAISEVQRLAENCRWRAFRQFARAPAIIELTPGSDHTADLRFGVAGERNFSVFDLHGECPTHLPPWTPPFHFGWEEIDNRVTR